MNMAKKIFQLDDSQVVFIGTALGYAITKSAGNAFVADENAKLVSVRDEMTRQFRSQPDIEVWYEVEYSNKGENDWFRTGEGKCDSVEGAKARVKRYADVRMSHGFDYRIVKEALISEVVE